MTDSEAGASQSEQNRYSRSRLVLGTTLWLTLFVLSVKVSAGWATRSLSLLAESIHTLIASFSTLLSLLALTAPDRPTGREVYGHGKREAVVTLVLVAFLGFVGLDLLKMSGQQLLSLILTGRLPFSVNVSLPLIQLLGVITITTLGLFLLGVYQARTDDSPTLRFNTKLLLRDVALMVLVVGGLIGARLELVCLDVVLAIALVILATICCWQVIRYQLPLLIQQTAIAPEIIAQIAHSVGGVTHCYKIQSRGIVGRLVFIQMHIILHPEFSSVTSLIVERIENAIREQYGPVQVTFFLDEIANLNSK